MSFVLTKSTLQNAAMEVRAARSRLDAIVRRLEDAGVWSGADAERFRRDWADQVDRPLIQAAALLDGVSFVTLV